MLSDKHTRVFYDSEKRLKAQIKRAVCRINMLAYEYTHF